MPRFKVKDLIVDIGTPTPVCPADEPLTRFLPVDTRAYLPPEPGDHPEWRRWQRWERRHGGADPLAEMLSALDRPIDDPRTPFALRQLRESLQELIAAVDRRRDEVAAALRPTSVEDLTEAEALLQGAVEALVTPGGED
jgi:hypothetical protein